MKITVKVKLNAKKTGVVKLDDANYAVSLNVPPIEGRANAALIEILADYFQVAKSQVEIKHGLKNKLKVFEIG
jgi:hypothetical protein